MKDADLKGGSLYHQWYDILERPKRKDSKHTSGVTKLSTGYSVRQNPNRGCRDGSVGKDAALRHEDLSWDSQCP